MLDEIAVVNLPVTLSNIPDYTGITVSELDALIEVWN